MTCHVDHSTVIRTGQVSTLGVLSSLCCHLSLARVRPLLCLQFYTCSIAELHSDRSMPPPLLNLSTYQVVISLLLNCFNRSHLTICNQTNPRAWSATSNDDGADDDDSTGHCSQEVKKGLFVCASGLARCRVWTV